MPKSKRSKIVHLTKTAKKGSEAKTNLVKQLRDSLDEYKNIYVFEYNSMRNNHLKDMRLEWTDSTFLMGKNKVIRVALGRTPEEEYRDGLARLGEDLTGNVGLLLTNRDTNEVQDYFSKFVIKDYPRTGNVATYEVALEAGPLEHFVPSMCEQLRKLGLPVQLKNGVIHLLEKYTICKEGTVLTPEQAKLLMHFDHQMAEFRIKLLSQWTDGKYTSLTAMEE